MSNEKKLTGEIKKTLLESLEKAGKLGVWEIYEMFPEVNQKTISWRLYDMVRKGELERPRHGYYALPAKQSFCVEYDYLQMKSQRVFDILLDYGYPFCITGLDALIGQVLHAPEQYPVLLTAEPEGVQEVKKILSESEFIVVTDKERSIYRNDTIRNKIDALILTGTDSYASGSHIANKEDGFIDLYYAVTRMDYPVSIQELYRIYQNLISGSHVNTAAMSKASSRRRVHTEIDFLVDMKKTPKKALEFIKRRIGDII